MAITNINEKASSWQTSSLPVSINVPEVQWLVVGGGNMAYQKLQQLISISNKVRVNIIAPQISTDILRLAADSRHIKIAERAFHTLDFEACQVVIAATENVIEDQLIKEEATAHGKLVYIASAPAGGHFFLSTDEKKIPLKITSIDPSLHREPEQNWRKLATRLVIAFALMIVGHLIISYLPLPTFGEIWANTKPYFNHQFLFFVLAGFAAQMVDGVLSMGYGVTSATCLMSLGINPVAVSAAIHTSEIFTTGISGYSHYKFGNVNKKMFRHLVIPGVIGAVLGAVLLVVLGESSGKWLMPVIAVYAGFLGLKILIKAFQQQPQQKKVKRIGWLAGVGGFMDSFGGGGWGPIVTSSLIAKGRSPKYTVGSVSLTEFFVTLASAFTFFVTIGVSHWNIVLGLLLGGSAAAPIAARLAGKLPRKTMMIAVGVMVMIWCLRMLLKSIL